MYNSKNVLNRNFFLFFFISASVFSLWLLAYYPGCMSQDSLDEWYQGTIFKFNNLHPAIHILILRSLRLIWDSPVIVSIAQIFLTSLLISYLLSYFLMKKESKAYILLSFVLFVSSPAIGIYNVTLWKDVIYTQLIFLICVIWLIDLEAQRNNLFASPKRAMAFALIIALLASVRHNGVVYLFFIPFLYFVFKMIHPKTFMKLLILCGFLYLLLNPVLFRLLHVKNESVIYRWATLKTQYIGAILNGGANLTEEESKVIEQVMPLPLMKSLYDSSCQDYIVCNFQFNIKLFHDSSYLEKFHSVANKIIMRNIKCVLKNRICYSAYLLGLSNPNSTNLLYADFIFPNEMGLRQEGIGILKNAAKKYLQWSAKWPQRFYFWNHLFYLLIYMIYLARAFVRRDKKLMGYILIILINVPVIVLMGPCGDFRYLYMLPFAIFFLPLVDGLHRRGAAE